MGKLKVEQMENAAYKLVHSTAMRNITKVWKTETGLSQGDIACSRGPESELFEILPYRDH